MTAVPVEVSPKDPAEISRWIAELDDNRYLIREQAARELLAAGTAALDPLLVAANGDRPEPADRSLWILQKLSRKNDAALARAALLRLVQLQNRPNIVIEARNELARVSLQVVEQKLEALGAEVSTQLEAIALSDTPAVVVQVVLGEEWRGRSEDLRPLAEETFHQHFRLNGSSIDDEVVKYFEAKEDLAWLQLINSTVSVSAVDSLKARRPSAVIYLRNTALLGVAAASNGAGKGVAVQLVPPGTGAAAAGIREGDLLLTIDGKELPDFDRMTAHIAQRKPGDVVELEVQRGNEKLKLQATLGSWTEQPM